MATQTLTIDEYLRLPYQIVLARGEGEDAGWTASVSELPGADAAGRTPEEASARVVDAMAAWIEKALADGRTVPAPWAALSGRLLVRMPRTLHADLARVASREQVSLNQFITTALASAVAWRQNGAPASAAVPDEAPPAREAPPASSRILRLALIGDLVLVAVAAVVAVVLLANGA
jgi:antitoxin HicB